MSKSLEADDDLVSGDKGAADVPSPKHDATPAAPSRAPVVLRVDVATKAQARALTWVVYIMNTVFILMTIGERRCASARHRQCCHAPPPPPAHGTARLRPAARPQPCWLCCPATASLAAARRCRTCSRWWRGSWASGGWRAGARSAHGLSHLKPTSAQTVPAQRLSAALPASQPPHPLRSTACLALSLITGTWFALAVRRVRLQRLAW